MYNKVLTVILSILLIAILVTIGFLVKTFWNNYTLNKDAEEFLEEFDTLVVKLEKENIETVTKTEENNTVSNNVANNTSNSISLTYKGFKVVGKLEMPSINIRYPILGENEKAKTLEVSVVKIYGPEVNQPGNVIIAGHNYNNSLFFGKNKNLKIGDKIYITDMQGKKVEYTIYSKYYTPEGDYSYMTRDTKGATEVTLYTCDATGANRLIICARAN